jgi:hypothetical protein
MRTIYTTEDLAREKGLPAIFLAGPSPRGRRELAWRPEAMELFKKAGFTGVIHNPEDRHEFKGGGAYSADWEDRAFKVSDVILFWVPRRMENMPGLTTNVEFGLYAKDPRSIYGRPDDADHIGYLDWVWDRIGKGEPHRTLEATIRAALLYLERKP